MVLVCPGAVRAVVYLKALFAGVRCRSTVAIAKLPCKPVPISGARKQ